MSWQGELNLYGDAPAPNVLHMLMPNMATACGRCTMWDCRECERRVERASSTCWVMNSSEATCPECLAVDIPAKIARMQSNQAAVTA